MKIQLIPTIIFFILASQMSAQADTGGKTGFAVGPDASVYLLIPSAEKKVQHISSGGILQQNFGDEGPGKGQLLAPIDILLYKEKIYILDQFGPQVKVFSLKGDPILEFGKNFPDEQKMKKPLMMRIRYSEQAKKDILYILDTGKKMVMKYTPDGSFIESLDFPPDDEKYFDWMTAFNVDQFGSYWITVDSTVDNSFRYILHYDEAMFPIDYVQLSKVEKDGFLADILPIETGGYIVADMTMNNASSYPGALLTFDLKNKPTDRKEIYDKNTQKFYSPKRFQIVSGAIYVLSSTDILVKLNENYEVIQTWQVK